MRERQKGEGLFPERKERDQRPVREKRSILRGLSPVRKTSSRLGASEGKSVRKGRKKLEGRKGGGILGSKPGRRRRRFELFLPTIRERQQKKKREKQNT